ncbi:hypothetical protein PTSG_00527 [Salpingoeca rosetta]|uniref:Uncharacterized protein n=1 Tax=Salpingoeca rosetta (strain ATCC 50818 / BSB-021) TaxID=946362 RepID=F2TWQ5_SALR5|nr:uncharacterized protein PTSG_00527 [Salpingoeca rosetta]EGD72501.1 hypothetical protein PTSG_00527 [Salpingoeca rosetta]|eukprot:XP_004999070.1 hypothetical protein PTSG_00527 [Salpingoeca rosetta]
MAGSFVVDIDWAGTGTHCRVQTLPLAGGCISRLPAKDIAAQVSVCCPTARNGLDPRALLGDHEPEQVFKANLRLSQLLNHDTLRQLTTHGVCCASTNLNARAPPSLCCVLDASGTLTIVCDKDTFETIGLEAAHTIYGRHYIRLALPSLLGDDGNGSNDEQDATLRRVRWCFANTLTDTFQVFVTVPPPPQGKGRVPAAVLQTVFADMTPVQPRRSTIEATTTRGDMQACVRECLSLLHDKDPSPILEPFDCLGAFALGTCPAAAKDEVASCFDLQTLPASNSAIEVTTATTACLLSSSILNGLVEKCRDAVHNSDDNEGDAVPWCAITLHGYEHSPYSFKQKPRAGVECGDNMLSILISRDNPTLLLCVTGNRDDYH